MSSAWPDEKAIRSKVIVDYLRVAGAAYDGIVIFTCGNAAKALRHELDGELRWPIVEVGPSGDLSPNYWWRPEEIRATWPRHFDATPGHLPAFLMVRIAAGLRAALGNLTDRVHEVPTGSGETITCLRWAYPRTEFTPVTRGDAATEWHYEAPLAPLWYTGK